MALGAPRKHHDAWRFNVEIAGIPFAGFSKCSGIEMDVEPVEYREGGVSVPRKTPGLVSFSDITLERGASMDPSLLVWAKLVLQALGDSGAPEPLYMKTVDIVQRDRDGSEMERWRLFNGWPRNFKTGDWDNSGSDLRMESLTLAYESFEYIPVAAIST